MKKQFFSFYNCHALDPIKESLAIHVATHGNLWAAVYFHDGNPNRTAHVGGQTITFSNDAGGFARGIELLGAAIYGLPTKYTAFQVRTFTGPKDTEGSEPVGEVPIGEGVQAEIRRYIRGRVGRAGQLTMKEAEQ